MPVIPTTGPGTTPRQGRPRRDVSPVVVGGAPRTPQVPPRAGVPSVPARRGYGQMFGQVADRIERNRLLKMRLKEREEDKKEARRQAILTANLAAANDWSNTYASGLRVRESFLEAAVTSGELGAMLASDPDGVNAWLQDRAAKEKLTHQQVYDSSSGFVRDALTAYREGRPIPNWTDHLESLQAEYRDGQRGRVPLQRADGSSNPAGVALRLDTMLTQEFLLSYLNMSAEANRKAEDTKLSLEAATAEKANRQQLRLNLASTRYIAASDTTPEGTRRGIEHVLTAARNLANDPAFVASLTARGPATAATPAANLTALGRELERMGVVTGWGQTEEHLKAISDDPRVGWMVDTEAAAMAAIEILAPALGMMAGRLPMETIKVTEEIGGKEVVVAKVEPSEFVARYKQLTPRERAVLSRLASDFTIFGGRVMSANVIRQAAVRARVQTGLHEILTDVEAVNADDPDALANLMILRMLREAEEEGLADELQATLAARQRALTTPATLQSPPVIPAPGAVGPPPKREEPVLSEDGQVGPPSLTPGESMERGRWWNLPQGTNRFPIRRGSESRPLERGEQ